MLAHQLPRLPRLDDLKSRLAALLVWIDEPRAAIAAAVREVPLGRQEAQIAPAGIQYWGTGVPVEAVRFAGANRLMVEFSYHGKHRRVEPYSIRRASTGNVLLYAWEQASGHVKAFNVAEIVGMQATDTPFTPRYQIEFTAHGPISAAATSNLAARRSPRLRVSSTGRHGPTYVFECTYCRKRSGTRRMIRRFENTSRRTAIGTAPAAGATSSTPCGAEQLHCMLEDGSA